MGLDRCQGYNNAETVCYAPADTSYFAGMETTLGIGVNGGLIAGVSSIICRCAPDQVGSGFPVPRPSSKLNHLRL
jgi:hypothetical protein